MSINGVSDYHGELKNRKISMIDIRKRSKLNNGYSLVELMLSMTIILIAMISIIGLFVTLFRSSQKGLDLTNGLVVAESVMNQYIYDKQEMAGGLYSNLTDNSASPVTGTTENDYGDELSHKTIYSYQIICRDVKTTAPLDLKKLDVTVSWWRDPEKESEYKTGYGRLTVHISRLVYTSEKMEVIPEF